MPTPEEKSRQNIDHQLEVCGWVLQDMSDMNIMAGLGVAVREYQILNPCIGSKAVNILCRPYAAGLRYGRRAFTEWLSDQQQQGDAGEFTEEQLRWLVAIKGHIASSLMIEQDDFEYAPFNQFGGIGRAYELFGRRKEVDNQLAA